MGSPYIGYYFSPLVSFWFIIVYLIFWLGHSYSTSLYFVVFKTLAASILVKFLITFAPAIDVPFQLLKYGGLGQGWDAREWRFRLELDSYICFSGVIVGLLLGRFRKQSIHPSWTMGAVALSLLGLTSVGFIIYREHRALNGGMRLSEAKVDYNGFHAEYSVIPIIAYAILRNSTSKLRRTYSTFFAWFGRISLETFIMQFHIFLAADTKATLVVLPNSSISWAWWLNFGIVSVLFLYASERVASASGALGDWIVGSGGGWKIVSPLLIVVVATYAIF